MDTTASNRIPNLIAKIYFAIAAILVVSEFFSLKTTILFLKPTLIPTLIVWYVLTSAKKSPLYISALVFALFSNVFFISESQDFLLYGIIAFMVYRILSIIVVVKLVDTILWVPFIIATLPFLFIFSCLINLTMTSDSPSFYPTIINGLLIAGLAGIALSNYVMNDNKANSWLAISTLLFIVLVFLFMIEKYYLSNIAFKPLSAFIFAFAHFTFYKFVLEAEQNGKRSDDY
ncbi:lysoplasmalogenase family protein [Flavobacterium sp.]|uniref:lysoplasmalogenase family protein n=1 Tax=Flavobacterium sp. TaxID=239 RepID=UPI0039E510BD